MSNNRLVWCLYRIKCQTIDWYGVYTGMVKQHRLKCQTIDWFGFYTD